MRISFIGTGLMGSPMAERLIDSGHELYVFNRTLEKTTHLKQKGAKVALTSHEALSLSDITILMLSDAKAVNEALFSTDEELKFTGHTIIQMSTISPEESRLLEQSITALGGSYIEAPVLGSIPQASEGKLIVMVGGKKELFDEFKPLFEVLGSEIFYIGKIGKASSLKLAFNQLIATLTAAFSLSLGIVQKENIEVEQFMTILRKSALYAKTFDVKLNNMLNDNFSSVNFPAKHLLKDMNLTLNMTDELKIDSTVLQAVAKLLQKTLDLGNAEKDYSVLYDSVVTK